MNIHPRRKGQMNGMGKLQGNEAIAVYRTKAQNKKSVILKVLLPIIAGIIIGPLLFIYGELDDAPGLCLIGIIFCIGMLYTGLNNASKINRIIDPMIILPLLIGITGLAWIVKYLIEGEYDEPPGLVLIGIILSIGLIIAGGIRLRKKLQDIRFINQGNSI